MIERLRRSNWPRQASQRPIWLAGSLVALIQSLFYVVTGVWPLVSRASFERITGPKTDFWLVRTVGVLITVIGLVLGVAGLRRSATTELALLGAGSAAGLAGIDSVYVTRQRVSRVYLLDALAELGLIVAWILAWRSRASWP